MKNAVAKALASFDAREAQGVDTCTTCPRLCRWACPVAEVEGRETVSPWNQVTLGGFVRRGLATPAAAGDLSFHCAQCGACTEACLHHNDVPLLVDLSRARALVAHTAPAPVAEVRGHFAVAANPYGASLEPALEGVLADAQVERRASPGDDPLYLPGCATLKERPEAARAFLRALALRGLGSVAVTELSAGCCGLPLLWAGDIAGFRAHAERYAASLSGAKEIVAHDPACADALRRRYADFGVELAPKVRSVEELLVERLGLASDEAQPPPSQLTPAAPVAYMDSCQLARQGGVVDAPRRLVARATGATACELPGLRGRAADCCGAGGLLPHTAPATARALAEARVEAFHQTGSAELCVSSPRCAAHLARTSPATPVVDLSALIARLT